MVRNNRWWLGLPCAIAVALTLGCAEEGPAETAGREFDEAASETGEAMEDTAEDVQDAAEGVADGVEDTVEDEAEGTGSKSDGG
jgi:hypothetical protein